MPGPADSLVMSTTKQQHMARRLAQDLLQTFPKLDLRLNTQAGRPAIRLIAPEFSTRVIELQVIDKSPDELLMEAVFAVKELGQLFDA